MKDFVNQFFVASAFLAATCAIVMAIVIAVYYDHPSLMFDRTDVSIQLGLAALCWIAGKDAT